MTEATMTRPEVNTGTPTTYDSVRQGEYDEYLPFLLGEISAGYFDAHLKEIARVVFYRRDILKGTNSFTGDGKEGGEGQEDNSTQVNPLPPGIYINPWTNQPYELYSGPVFPIPSRVNGSFTFNGNLYRKDRFVGKVIEVPAVQAVPAYLWSEHVLVQKIGKTRATVTFLTYPKHRRSGMTYAVHEALVKGMPIALSTFIFANIIAQY